MYTLKLLSLLCAAMLHQSFHAEADSIQYAGVNLAGADFGESSLPGTHGIHYIYPNQDEVDYFNRRGMNTIRLPFRWERLQRSLNADFDATELGRLNDFVTQATAKGMYVVLDPHNYARYHGGLIGSPAVPYAAFDDFWTRLADLYKSNDRVIFALVNEPNAMPTEQWFTAAQSSINAIRATGANNLILVPGNGFTGAHSWLDDWYGTPNGIVMLEITDPGNNYAFEVHQYLDSDSSGTTDGVVSPTIGVDRIRDFTEWCRSHGKRAFLGEFAVPNATIGAGIGDEAINNMMSYMTANSDVWLGWTWWAAGPWWGAYLFSLEPTSNFTVDRPAMSVLRAHLPLPKPAIKITENLQLEFPTRQGFDYQLESREDLSSGQWDPVSAAFGGTGGWRSISLNQNRPAEFFRVSVSLGP